MKGLKRQTLDELHASVRLLESEGLPITFWDEKEIELQPPFMIPKVGVFIPPGWSHVQTHLVSKSTLTDEGNGQLTIAEFKELLLQRLHTYKGTSTQVGWGICEDSDLVVRVCEYRKEINPCSLLS